MAFIIYKGGPGEGMRLEYWSATGVLRYPTRTLSRKLRDELRPARQTTMSISGEVGGTFMDDNPFTLAGKIWSWQHFAGAPGIANK